LKCQKIFCGGHYTNLPQESFLNIAKLKQISEPVISASKTLDWLLEQIEGDSIEDVTDEMLDKLVSGHLAGDGFCKLNSWIYF
jgi:hypothetical protein